MREQKDKRHQKDAVIYPEILFNLLDNYGNLTALTGTFNRIIEIVVLYSLMAVLKCITRRDMKGHGVKRMCSISHAMLFFVFFLQCG